MGTGEYDKILNNGIVVPAPKFTKYALNGIPVLFKLAEWLIAIAVFQYADIKFHFLAAKIIWIFLGVGFAVYLGLFLSNLAWRHIDEPYGSKLKDRFMSYGIPVMSGILVFFLLKVVLSQIVKAH